MSVIVKYTETPWNSYDYLVEVGYWNGIVNLRTYSPIPRPLSVNGKQLELLSEAAEMILIIQKQFPHEEYTYRLRQCAVDELV